MQQVIYVVATFTFRKDHGLRYILAATDYFSKWAKAIVVRDFVSMTVAEFIRVYTVNQFWRSKDYHGI